MSDCAKCAHIKLLDKRMRIATIALSEIVKTIEDEAAKAIAKKAIEEIKKINT